MTTPSGTELTDEQLNVMVTEAVGLYVHCEGRVLYASSRPEPDFQRRFFAYEPLIQKFSTSLDACATFEATLSPTQLKGYATRLCMDYLGLTEHPMFEQDWYAPCLLATPRRRCIAFLRMKGVL